jgi:hypothetical protein
MRHRRWPSRGGPRFTEKINAEIYDGKLVNTDKNSDAQRAAGIDFERNAHFWKMLIFHS